MNIITVSIMMTLVGVTLATGMVARKKDGGKPTIQKLSSGADLDTEVYKSLGHQEHVVRKLHTRSLAHPLHLNRKGIGELYQRSQQMRAGIPLFKYFLKLFKKLPLLGKKIRSLIDKLTKPQFTHLTGEGEKRYQELKKKYNLPDFKTLRENAIPKKKETLNGKSALKTNDLNKRPPNHQYERRYDAGYRPNAMRRNYGTQNRPIHRKHPEVDLTQNRPIHRQSPGVDLSHGNPKPRERYHYSKRAFSVDKYGMEKVKFDYSKVEKDLKDELKHKHNGKKLDAKELKSGMKNQNENKLHNSNQKNELNDKKDNLPNNDDKNTNRRDKHKGKLHYGKRRFTMDKYGMENVKLDYSKLKKDFKETVKKEKGLKNGVKLNNGVKNGSKNNKNLKKGSENIKNGKSEKSSQN